MPWASRFVDRLSHRFLVPRYAAKAAAIVAVSEVTREQVMQYLHVPPDRVTTVYSGVDDVFRSPPKRGRATKSGGSTRCPSDSCCMPERFTRQRTSPA